MASAIQVIHDGDRNLVIKAIGSVAVTAELIVDLSTVVPSCTRVNIMRTIWNADSAVTSATLLWDATTPLSAVVLSNPGSEMDFSRIGGLTNNAGAGVTGGIKLTTVGAGAYSLLIELTKHGVLGVN